MAYANVTWPMPACLLLSPPHHHTVPWVTIRSICFLLNMPCLFLCRAFALVPSLLTMFGPYLQLRQDLLHEAYLLLLLPFRETAQSHCCGPPCCWHISQLVLSSAMSLPNGPANSSCSRSWHSGPSRSLFLDSLLLPSSNLIKAENLKNICSWSILLLVGSIFLNPLSMPHIPRKIWDCRLDLFVPGDPCDTPRPPCVGMGWLSTVIYSKNHRQTLRILST